MTGPAARSNSAIQYVLRISGHLDERWSTWFGGMTVTHQGDGTTTPPRVCGRSGRAGVLAKVRDFGATLISVALANAIRDGGC